MWPLGVLKKKGDANILLDLPFTTDMLDKSSYNTPLRIAGSSGGTPAIIDGALFMPASGGTSAFATGTVDGEAQAHLDLKNKKYTIEFEFKNGTALTQAGVFKMSKNIGSSGGGGVGSPSYDRISVNNSSNTGIMSYVFGYDAFTQFVKVKIKRIAATLYELYVDDVLVTTTTNTSNVMFSTIDDRAQGVVFQTTFGRPFYIKNFKITSNGIL